MSAETNGGEGVSRRRAGELTNLVLGTLRQAERAQTPADVLRQLTDRGAGPLAYTTVVTILSRLHDQGVVDRFRTGRAYAYLPVGDPAKLAARRMRRTLEAEDDRDAVLASFVSELSTEDEHLLRELLGNAPGDETVPGSRPDSG